MEKELSNGRLAMIGMAGYIAQEFVTKQLKDHFNFFKNSLLQFLDFEFISIGSCSTVTTLCAIHKKLNFHMEC